VRVQFVAAFGRLIPLAQLRATFTPAELEVVRRGTRLSVMPVAPAVAERLLSLALFSS
jgi:predicted RNA-binding protein with PUA-like domain